jgi:crotonobetainyl-CoA:carnitine CoA-transferase CaiB-like acyl-CoA transferase
MTDWKTDLDALVFETMAFAKTNHREQLPADLIERPRLQPMNWGGPQREEIKQRVANFKAHQQSKWPAQKDALAAAFRTRTREQWTDLLCDSDTCVAPVLDWDEAPRHSHNAARNTFLTIDGTVQPAPAPRFSRTAVEVPRSAAVSGGDTFEVLRRWGVGTATIDRLRAPAPN